MANLTANFSGLGVASNLLIDWGSGFYQGGKPDFKTATCTPIGGKYKLAVYNDGSVAGWPIGNSLLDKTDSNDAIAAGSYGLAGTIGTAQVGP